MAADSKNAVAHVQREPPAVRRGAETVCV